MSLAANIWASATGRLWLALLQIGVMPIIVTLLGPDNYGLAGFSIIISMFLMLLDQSISPALSREMARTDHATEAGARGAHDLLRTFELVSCGTGVAVGGSVMVLAPWIAEHAIAKGPLPINQVTTALLLTGVVIAAQWPGMLYAAGLTGLQRQDLLMAIRVMSGTFSTVGAAALLWVVGPSINLYLSWLILVAAVTSVSLGVTLWKAMPTSKNDARFCASILKRLGRFSVGNLLIGLLSALLLHAPGLIIAKFCTLPQLAAYSLSMTLAQQVSSLLTQPVINTLMPHFTQLSVRGVEADLAREYHRWSQIVVALILPVSGLLIAFPHALIEFWLGGGSPLLGPVAQLLPVMAIGSALNGIMTPPYILQISAGWTRLSIMKSIIGVVTIVPALFLLVPQYGPMAAAGGWIAINLGFYLFEVPYMHRHLLIGEEWRWWLRDTLLPTAAVTSVFILSRLLVQHGTALWPTLLQALATAAIAFGALGLVLPNLRREAETAVRRLLAFRKRRNV